MSYLDSFAVSDIFCFVSLENSNSFSISFPLISDLVVGVVVVFLVLTLGVKSCSSNETVSALVTSATSLVTVPSGVCISKDPAPLLGSLTYWSFMFNIEYPIAPPKPRLSFLPYIQLNKLLKPPSFKYGLYSFCIFLYMSNLISSFIFSWIFFGKFFQFGSANIILANKPSKSLFVNNSS